MKKETLSANLVAIVEAIEALKKFQLGKLTCFFQRHHLCRNGGQVADHGHIFDSEGQLVARQGCSKAPNGQPSITVEASTTHASHEHKLEIDHDRRHRVRRITLQHTYFMRLFIMS